jgi:UDP-2-acetamido-2-deoxy-ribo-hexuluronate aminotransferase
VTQPLRSIPFVDLQAQRARLGRRVEERIERVLAHGAFVMGPEVIELEERLATFVGARHCITCANGTDALQMALRAREIGPGDAVIVPAFSFVAAAEAVSLVGATFERRTSISIRFASRPRLRRRGTRGCGRPA